MMDGVQPRTLDDQLRTEERTCSQCGYGVTNPLTDRCPRCFSPVPRVVVECGSCTHAGNCAFAIEARAAHRPV